MKSYCKIFGIIALAVIIGFSMTACADDGGDDLPSLDGSWHIAGEYNETFTFDTAAGTFTKMDDEGWGERGTFTFTAADFTTIKIEETKDGTTWTDIELSLDDRTETREYVLSGDTLLLNGKHEYTRVK
jgi:hypothetical protein